MNYRCSFLRELFGMLDFVDVCFKKRKIWVAVHAGTRNTTGAGVLSGLYLGNLSNIYVTFV
jgi:hypothetical protein